MLVSAAPNTRVAHWQHYPPCCLVISTVCPGASPKEPIPGACSIASTSPRLPFEDSYTTIEVGWCVSNTILRHHRSRSVSGDRSITSEKPASGVLAFGCVSPAIANHLTIATAPIVQGPVRVGSIEGHRENRRAGEASLPYRRSQGRKQTTRRSRTLNQGTKTLVLPLCHGIPDARQRIHNPHTFFRAR
jgi:hypothetical protein